MEILNKIGEVLFFSFKLLMGIQLLPFLILIGALMMFIATVGAIGRFIVDLHNAIKLAIEVPIVMGETVWKEHFKN